MEYNGLISLIMLNGMFGLIVGTITAIICVSKRKLGLAIGGFFACFFSGLLLGLILSIPMCILFVYLSSKKHRKQ